MTSFLCATCQKGPREADGGEILFKDDGKFFCVDHLDRASLRYEQALRQPLEPGIAVRLRAGGKAAPPTAPEARPDDAADLEEYIAAMAAHPVPANTSPEAAFEATPLSHRFGSGEKRKYYAAWPTSDGTWRAARDVWVKGPGKHKTRDIRVIGPFADRKTALDAAYALG